MVFDLSPYGILGGSFSNAPKFDNVVRANNKSQTWGSMRYSTSVQPWRIHNKICFSLVKVSLHMIHITDHFSDFNIVGGNSQKSRSFVFHELRSLVQPFNCQNCCGHKHFGLALWSQFFFPITPVLKICGKAKGQPSFSLWICSWDKISVPSEMRKNMPTSKHALWRWHRFWNKYQKKWSMTHLHENILSLRCVI